MSPEVSRIVNTTSIGAAVLGAVLSPIPFADEIALFPVFASVAYRIGKTHGLTVRTIPWKPIMLTAATGLAARAIVSLSVGFIPGVAAVANAFSAAGLTRLVGSHADEACADPVNARAWGIKQITELMGRKRAAAA